MRAPYRARCLDPELVLRCARGLIACARRRERAPQALYWRCGARLPSTPQGGREESDRGMVAGSEHVVA
jgi:hypothetical protein